MAGQRPRHGWGLGEVLVGFFASQVVSLIALVLVSGVAARGTALAVTVAEAASGARYVVLSGQPLASQALVQVPLWATQLATVGYAARGKGDGWQVEVGLAHRWTDPLLGLAGGVVAQLGVAALYGFGRLLGIRPDVEGPARELTGRAAGIGVLSLFLLFAVAAPVVEELFFRGLLLRSLETKLPRRLALPLSAIVFAAAHFQLVQLPGLVVAGLVFGFLAQSRDRLGPSMWAHATFNALTVANLVWG